MRINQRNLKASQKFENLHVCYKCMYMYESIWMCAYVMCMRVYVIKAVQRTYCRPCSFSPSLMGGAVGGQSVWRASIRQGLVMRSQLTFHCSLQQPRRKRTNLSIVISSSSSFIPPSMVKRRKVIPARSYFTPSICLLLPSLPLPFACLLLSIYLSVSLCHSPPLSLLPVSLSLFPSLLVQGDGGGCVWVSESTPQGLYSPLAWKIHDARECVCVCVSLTLRHWLEKGNRERRRKKERGWGDGGYRVWDKLTVHSRANSAGCDYTTGSFAHSFRRHLG